MTRFCESSTKGTDQMATKEWTKMMRDVAVDFADEFDRNFERKAFFDRKWRPRRLNERGSLLVSSGRLRRSILHKVESESIVFMSDAPYARLHNEGGKITVTQRMKGFFWYMYKKRRHAMYKALALKRVGSKIEIPQRQFIGYHRNLDRIMEVHAQELIEKMASNIASRLKQN